MPNDNRNKRNQEPTGQGKKQSPHMGRANKLNKRSEVIQASDARQNIGTSEDELNLRSFSASARKPERQKSGR
ncbi:MAG TPA: hypothetical protein VEF04_00830 [Blastocatellia bacterium]|nr:hypothetical protein [Blastocatellia bacterium]